MKIQNNSFPFLFSGKFGDQYGRVKNGKQEIVKKREPRRSKFSIRELEAQRNFATVASFLKPIIPIIRKYNDPVNRRDGYHKAMSLILRNAIQGVHPRQRIDYPNVTLGEGKLPNPNKYKVGSPAKGLLEFTWSIERMKRMVSKTDRLFTVVYSEASNQFRFELCGTERRERQFLMDVTLFCGQKVEVWFGFASASGILISTSVYAGCIHVL